MMVAISDKKTPWLAFNYGEERIEFKRSNRGGHSGRVLIKVHPDGQVEVSAPVDADDAEVLAAARKRGRWIYQQLREFRQQQEHVITPRFISGESLFYLGKRYVLKVIEAPDVPQSVKLLRGMVEVCVRHRSPEKVQALLLEWYRERAKEVFARRLEVMLEQALWVSERPPIRLLTMKTQWGSCSPNGRITLNPHLVKAPRDCIDYVILHELCHIAEHNHSERFYRLMGQIMPGWEQIKERLDGMAGVYLSGT